MAAHIDDYSEDDINWLEDSTTGRFQRHNIGGEESLWFCVECGYEHGECVCDDEEEVNDEEPCWL